MERLVVGFYLACGALLLFLSTIIWRENPKSRVNRSTAFMLGFAGLGPIFAAVGQSLQVPLAALPAAGQPFLSNLQYIWEFFFPFLVLFSLEFPVRHPFLIRQPRARWLIFVPHAFHILLTLALARGQDIATWIGTHSQSGLAGWLLDQLSRIVRLSSVLFDYLIDIHLKFFSVINLVYVVVALLVLQSSQKALTSARMKKQLSAVTVSLQIALGLYAIAFIAPILGLAQISPGTELGLMVVALLAGTGGVVYSIIRHQFLDVRLIARRSLVYSVTSAMLVGLYILIIEQLGSWVRQQVGQPTPILDVGFIIVAVIFFQPMMSSVEDLTQRFFLRDKTDYRRLMERFSSEVIRIVDLRQLQQQVISTLQEDLQVESVILVQILSPPKRLRFYSLSRLEGEYNDPDLQELLNAITSVTGPVYYDSLSQQVGDAHVWSVIAGFKPHILVPLRAGSELAGVLLLSRKSSAYRYSQEDFTVLHVLSNQVAVALTNALLYGASLEKERMEEELAVARQIQSALLPETLPQHEQLLVDAFSRPAREVGGDFYDFIPLEDGRLGVVIGDASGKSMSAALMIAQLQAVLRNEVRGQNSIPKIMESLNRCVAMASQSERFVTMVYGVLNPENGQFVYCNAGHNYPILARPDGSYTSLDTGGLLLGVFEDAQYEEGQIEMATNDVLVFYTDGFTEITNDKEEEFGDSRLVESILKFRMNTPQVISQSLMHEVLSHGRSASFDDDATVVVLKRKARDPQ